MKLKSEDIETAQHRIFERCCLIEEMIEESYQQKYFEKYSTKDTSFSISSIFGFNDIAFIVSNELGQSIKIIISRKTIDSDLEHLKYVVSTEIHNELVGSEN